MTGNTKREQTASNTRSYLWQGNSAVRAENYREAIELFHLALDQAPELRSTILFNIAIAEKKISELDSKNIKNIENKKIIVYTCNFGGYESIKEPLLTDPTVEYIIFTDDKSITSNNWKIVVIDEKLKDPRRTSRLAKIMPHRYLPDHDISVYIDSSLEIKTDDIRTMVAECLQGKDIALYKHYRRNCVYDEIKFVMNSTDRVVDDKDLCIKAIKKYEEINYPKNNGLYENGFMIRCNTKKIQEFSELWWKEYISGTERDQFTFMYATWLAGISPNPIGHGKQVRVNNYVNFYKHIYRSSSVRQKNKIIPHVFIAYAPKSYGMNLGRCYNEYMERLEDDEFAIFIDHDAMFVSDSWVDIVNELSSKHSNDVALFIARTNRINNPYQRLNLLENNHRIEDHKIFAAELHKQYSYTTTECAQLPSSSGVVLMLSKKTWKSHKFSDGFLKVDNNIHISHRGSGDPVYMMNGLHVYHFYRADNDMSHVIKDISSVREEESKSSLGHIVRNFIYISPAHSEIERCMKTLNEDEYGVFFAGTVDVLQ